jgi:O-antigen/teichoic acid export membrane protein
MRTKLRDLFFGGVLRASISKASGAAISLKVFNAALGFATTVLLARMLGPDSFGVYAFALAVVMIVGLPAKAGVPQLVTKETAKGQASGQWGTVKAVWRWSTAVVILVSFVALLAAALVGALYSERIEMELSITIGIGMLMIPVMGLALVRASSLRGLGHTVQGQLPELVIKPAVFLALLIAVSMMFSSSQFTSATAMGLNIAATAVAFFVGAALLQRTRPPELTHAKPSYDSRAWTATIIPMAAINAMHLINTQADILLIGIFMVSAEVGYYKVAAQMSLIVAFGLQATKMVVEPYFARFYHQREFVKLQRLSRAASRLNLTIAVAVLGLLIVLGKEILEMAFGVAFVAAFTPMLILSGGRLAGACLGSSGSLLVMAGYHREYARFWIIAAFLYVILNIIFIPVFGMVGAAIATSTTLLVPYICGWWAAKKWIGCDCSPFATIREV